jgi:hypothetical protein
VTAISTTAAAPKTSTNVACHPHGDPRWLVRIDPDVRFGRPMVKGVSTDVL